ncbi:MAG: sensor histidine kinase [Desulfovibrio sp.]
MSHGEGCRHSSTVVAAENQAVLSEELSKYLVGFPLPLLVINNQKQAVFLNTAFLSVVDADSAAPFLGMRPGEIMQCIYCATTEEGCGGSEHCTKCGAFRAITEAIIQKTTVQNDCQLLVRDSKGVAARDLRLFLSPWNFGGTTFYVITVLDVSDEKRRKALERLFYHDILNSVGGARNLIELVLMDATEETKESAELALTSLFGLEEEIKKQKELLAYENQEFTPRHITLQGLEVLRGVSSEYQKHPKALNKTIHLSGDCVNVAICADYGVLRRIIINMIVNALEAVGEGDTITLGLRASDAGGVFWVRNKSVIPKSVQLQIFKRSFSTKGEGRGLGTYSMKLLTENYLHGQVGFSSSVEDGTEFWAEIPAAKEIVL